MEKSIVLLLFFSVVLAVTSFYLGFINPAKNLSLAVKISFILVILILIPLFTAILWLQSGAKERLSITGIVPYPELKETIGVAFGIGERPVWLFKTGEDNVSIRSFYSNENNRQGWKLLDIDKQNVTLGKKDKIMIITSQTGMDKGSIMYVIEDLPVK